MRLGAISLSASGCKRIGLRQLDRQVPTSHSMFSKLAIPPAVGA